MSKNSPFSPLFASSLQKLRLCLNVHVIGRALKQSGLSGQGQHLAGGGRGHLVTSTQKNCWRLLTAVGRSEFSCVVIGPQPSTLPQGTVNMNLCTEIGDAEPRTGQKNAVCILTPEQEIFIRGDNKEIISG